MTDINRLLHSVGKRGLHLFREGRVATALERCLADRTQEQGLQETH